MEHCLILDRIKISTIADLVNLFRGSAFKWYCKKTPQTSYTTYSAIFLSTRYTEIHEHNSTRSYYIQTFLAAFVQDLENSMFWEHTQKTRVLPRASTLMTMQLWLMHHFFPQENLHTSLASPILFAHHATNQARSRVSIPFEVCRKCSGEYQDSFLDQEKNKRYLFWLWNKQFILSFQPSYLLRSIIKKQASNTLKCPQFHFLNSLVLNIMSLE